MTWWLKVLFAITYNYQENQKYSILVLLFPPEDFTDSISEFKLFHWFISRILLILSERLIAAAISEYTVKNFYCNFTINVMEVYYQNAMYFTIHENVALKYSVVKLLQMYCNFTTSKKCTLQHMYGNFNINVLLNCIAFW